MDVVEDIAQVGGHWAGGGDGVGSGLDFDGAVAAGGRMGDPASRVRPSRCRTPGGDPAEAAELLFNTVCWPYVHLRGRHRWPAERARHGLRRLMTPGLVAVPGPGTRPAGS
jgi:hypothetical protein